MKVIHRFSIICYMNAIVFSAFLRPSALHAASSFPWSLYLPAIIKVKGGGGVTEACMAGKWKRTYDWMCDGFTGSIIDTIKDDNTWQADSGSSGTWKLEGTTFTYTYPVGTVYEGSVNSTCSFMAGTMLSHTGNTGCWSAVRIDSEPGKRDNKSRTLPEAVPNSIENLDDSGDLK